MIKRVRKNTSKRRRKQRMHGRGSRERLVGYVRVSTEEQATEGVSLEVQEKRIRAYALAIDAEIVAVECDGGVSGAVAPYKRPALNSALATIDEGHADGIVFFKLDRLSRSVRHILALADDAQRRGWRLCSVTENIDTSSAMGKFTMGILALLAEMERNQIGERVRVALAQLSHDARPVSRRIPYGFRLEGDPHTVFVEKGEKRRLVEHPQEMEAIREILSLRYYEGWGARRITNYLLEKRRINPRTKEPWTEPTIQKLIITDDRRRNLGIGIRLHALEPLRNEDVNSRDS